jgi:hypothetical protein
MNVLGLVLYIVGLIVSFCFFYKRNEKKDCIWLTLTGLYLFGIYTAAFLTILWLLKII